MMNHIPQNLSTGCTHTELGQAYSPNDTPGSARRLLKRWIMFHPTLLEQMRRTGYVPGVSRRMTPMPVQLIVDALGEPC